MCRFRDSAMAVLLVVFPLTWPLPGTRGDTGDSTRVTNPQQHSHRGGYRPKSDFIFKEMDLRPGDVVVDIGAGDGWWVERMAKLVGGKGIVYAAEVNKKQVEDMKKKFAPLPQIKPYLCKTDSTELPERSCDLAFFSQSYHHLELNGHVDYLRRLRKILKPTGRLYIIEKYPDIATKNRAHGTPLSRLAKEAEEAGWIPVRYELISGTYHYLAVFVQRDLFPPER